MTILKTVKVFAPATIANLGPGFDVLGMALDNPGDVVIAETKAEKGLTFKLLSPASDVPSDSTNVAAHVATLMIQALNPDFGITLSLQKNLPLCSGLGSSAASSAAAAYAINLLLPKPLDKKDLVAFAMEGEKLASGTAHADNVAPALLGGLCLIRSYQPLDILSLPYKNELYWVVIHPHLLIHTKTAREILPNTIPLSTSIKQTGNLGALITGLHLGDEAMIASSLQDAIAEPLRAPLIPGFYDIKRCAMAAGAIAFSISGSGPSVFALASSLPKAELIASTTRDAFSHYAGVASDIYLSRINPIGAKIIGEMT